MVEEYEKNRRIDVTDNNGPTRHDQSLMTVQDLIEGKTVEREDLWNLYNYIVSVEYRNSPFQSSRSVLKG